MRDICYRGDNDVTALVVGDSESGWVVTGADVAAASTGNCVCDLSCTEEDVRLFEYPANLGKARRLRFATGPKL